MTDGKRCSLVAGSSAKVKALARAFRWRKTLDTGVHAALEDFGRAKCVAPSYIM